MDQPECRKNRAYYIDSIQFSSPFKSFNLRYLRELYVEKGLTTRQIAKKLRVSKSFIIGRLHLIGIKRDSVQEKSLPPNHRLLKAPYGYSKEGNTYVVNRQELKVCRLIVELIGKKKLSLSRAARELNSRKIKKRKGDTPWNHMIVGKIYNHWKDKL